MQGGVKPGPSTILGPYTEVLPDPAPELTGKWYILLVLVVLQGGRTSRCNHLRSQKGKIQSSRHFK